MKPRFDPTKPTLRQGLSPSTKLRMPLVRAAGSTRLTKKELLALGRKKPAPRPK